MTANFNPQRLTVARRRRGKTMAALAEAAGLSTRIITAYERGVKEPGLLTLDRVAAVLEFPADFFSGPDLEELETSGTSFRKQSRLTAAKRDQALGSATIAIALSDWINERFGLPEPDIPRHEGVDPETAARSVRAEWGLGERPIPNMIHLLEARGVRVFSLSEECREMDAISFWRGSIPYVFLNTIKSGEHSRMDAAHELGHLVLHWRGGARGRNVEHEAQLFGSAFLMPRSSVLAEAPRGGQLDQIIRAKKRWKVSVAALVYRMNVVGLLSDWEYRTLFIKMNGDQMRVKEPYPIQGETSQVLGKVFKMLRAEGVSKADIARDLRIYPEELDRIVFGLTWTQVSGSGDASEPQSERPALRLV
jgi:Zn-dependent peptidase ImmA (M78 family)/DNA-binding XRE family transcriptional regulator